MWHKHLFWTCKHSSTIIKVFNISLCRAPLAIKWDPISAWHFFQRLRSSDRRHTGRSDLSVRVRRLALQSMLTDLHVRQLYTSWPLSSSALLLELSYYTVVVVIRAWASIAPLHGVVHNLVRIIWFIDLKDLTSDSNTSDTLSVIWTVHVLELFEI